MDFIPDADSPVTLKSVRLVSTLAAADPCFCYIVDAVKNEHQRIIYDTDDTDTTGPGRMINASTVVNSTNANIGLPSGEFLIQSPLSLYFRVNGAAVNDLVYVYLIFDLHGYTMPTVTLTRCAIDGTYTYDYDTVSGI